MTTQDQGSAGTFSDISLAFSDDLSAPLVIVPESDVPGDETTPVTLVAGDRVEEELGFSGDEDWYRLSLGADEAVSIAISAPDGGPLPDGIIEIALPGGPVIETRTIDDSNPILYAQAQAGDVFIRISSPTGDTGAYAVDVRTALPDPFSDPANPLLTGMDTGLTIAGNDSNKAARRIDFAFARAGDVYDDRLPIDEAADLDWTEYEKQQLRAALQEFENVLDIEIVEVSNLADAELKFFAAELNGDNSNNTFNSRGFLGFAFLPTGGSLAGNVIFNTDGFGWDRNEATGDDFDGGLEKFGLGFQTVLHELGHAFGLDHPYEEDQRTTLFPGIIDANNDGFTDNLFRDSGSFGLNQTTYTVMSDVTGWTEHPDGEPGVFSFSDGLATRPEFGAYAGTLMALDLAVLQRAYGAKENVALGDDVYILQDTQSQETGYSSIWDLGGVDEIRHVGTRDAWIDLRQATLEVEDGGGGFVSFVDGGNPSDPAIGGFTIPVHVDIENARSDQGSDLLVGNALDNWLSAGAAADTLLGGAGNDTLDGGLGDDLLEGGEGNDTLSYASMADPFEIAGLAIFGAFVDLGLQDQAQDTNQGMDTAIGFENLEGSQFADFFTGDDADNRISGGDGRDRLFGEGGSDTIEGGLNQDVISGGAGADTLSGGEGIADLVSYARVAQNLTFDFRTPFRNPDGSVNAANQSSEPILEDFILDDVEGYAGSNEFQNAFFADGFDKRLFLTGGEADDFFFGGANNDAFLGGRGTDIMYGNEGRDALRGGAGDDGLFGGTGADFYFFDGSDGTDTIHDFAVFEDSINFVGNRFPLFQRGDLTFSTVDADGDGEDDGEITIANASTRILVIDVDGATLDAEAILIFG